VALNDQSKSTVQIKLGDGSTYAQPGTLDFSDTAVDPSTGSVTLRALLPNPDRVLLPGAFVTFAVNLGQRNNAYLIPQEAILRDAKGAYALIVGKDGKVVRKDVVTAAQQQDKWIITAGLQPGDQIIVNGLQKAKEGEPAKATPWTPGAPGQASAGAAPQGQAAAKPQGAANGDTPAAAAADSKPEQQ